MFVERVGGRKMGDGRKRRKEDRTGANEGLHRVVAGERHETESVGESCPVEERERR